MHLRALSLPLSASLSRALPPPLYFPFPSPSPPLAKSLSKPLPQSQSRCRQRCLACPCEQSRCSRRLQIRSFQTLALCRHVQRSILGLLMAARRCWHAPARPVEGARGTRCLPSSSNAHTQDAGTCGWGNATVQAVLGCGMPSRQNRPRGRTACCTRFQTGAVAPLPLRLLQWLRSLMRALMRQELLHLQ